MDDLLRTSGDARAPMERGESASPLLGRDLTTTGPSYATGLQLSDYFLVGMHASPKGAALEFGCTSYSYAELDVLSAVRARHLQSLGVKVGSRVGFVLRRTPELYFWLLAVTRLAATYVPMDPSFPAGRIATIVEDASIELLLTDRECHTAVLDPGCPVVVTDAVHLSEAGEPDVRADRVVDADDLAYVIYTSGSTGRPKGVMITQRNICTYLDGVRGVYGLASSDRVFQGISLAFDFSAEQIWATWHAGATVVIGPEDGRLVVVTTDLVDRPPGMS